ncbi:alpha/beta fold hydrolase [Euzebya sp.]|uniref:alpha/beta fold hydrolase n=1 Tax=Euzebya sp. TaxID=1971409 RepID=UPI0035194EFC
MPTSVLIHGAGSSGRYWHRVAPLLEVAGHRVVAPDLPAEDDDADLTAYVDAVLADVDAGGSLDPPVVVVGQSLGGFTAPLVADELGADLLVILAGMVPRPGERGVDWWTATGWEAAVRTAAREGGRDPEDLDTAALVLAGVPHELLVELGPERAQSMTPLLEPWPLTTWPDVPTRVVAAADDRFFPLDFQRRVAADRLGLDVVEVPGGHLPAVTHPEAVAAWLLELCREVAVRA